MYSYNPVFFGPFSPPCCAPCGSNGFGLAVLYLALATPLGGYGCGRGTRFQGGRLY